jgi:hypothetical protein
MYGTCRLLRDEYGMNLFTFFVKKIAIKRARPPHAKLRETILMEVELHGYAISDVHGSGNIVQVFGYYTC